MQKKFGTIFCYLVLFWKKFGADLLSVPRNTDGLPHHRDTDGPPHHKDTDGPPHHRDTDGPPHYRDTDGPPHHRDTDGPPHHRDTDGPPHYRDTDGPPHYRDTDGQGRRQGGPGGPDPQSTCLAPSINKLTFLKTVDFVLNFKLWPPPDKRLAPLSRLLWRRLC